MQLITKLRIICSVLYVCLKKCIFNSHNTVQILIHPKILECTQKVSEKIDSYFTFITYFCCRVILIEMLIHLKGHFSTPSTRWSLPICLPMIDVKLQWKQGRALQRAVLFRVPRGIWLQTNAVGLRSPFIDD